MKRLPYIIIGVIAVILIYFGIVNRGEPQPNDKRRIEQLTNVTEDAWETKTNEEPPVTIAVTPLELGKNIEIWKFQITLDTHTGSLDDDLITAGTLTDDNDNAHQPLSWEGPGPGGHHREGILVFEAISPAPSYIELKIKNVGGIPERSFTWNLE